jgi:hypothetical protein
MEYEKVYTKDQSDKKDLNHLALQDLKRAQYYFAYLRTNEKLYNRELQKQGAEIITP